MLYEWNANIDAYDPEGQPAWSRTIALRDVDNEPHVQLDAGTQLYVMIGGLFVNGFTVAALDEDGGLAWQRDIVEWRPGGDPQFTRIDAIGASLCGGVVVAGEVREASATRTTALMHLGNDGVSRALVRVQGDDSGVDWYDTVHDVKISWRNEVMVLGANDGVGDTLWMRRY